MSVPLTPPNQRISTTRSEAWVHRSQPVQRGTDLHHIGLRLARYRQATAVSSASLCLVATAPRRLAAPRVSR